MSFIIAGIHTGIGKTICSAVLTEALGYDYWKPVQAGHLENSDSIFIRNHIANTELRIHHEAYRLSIPASPHYAAEQDGVEITLDKLLLPVSKNQIIVETAGGIMSPLSNSLLNTDLMSYLQLPVILVSNNYLGSINHTLLSIAALQAKNIPITGIIFSGHAVLATQEFILQYSGLPLLLSVPEFNPLNKDAIVDFAQNIADNLKQRLHDAG